jgi:hypothetical protein
MNHEDSTGRENREPTLVGEHIAEVLHISDATFRRMQEYAANSRLDEALDEQKRAFEASRAGAASGADADLERANTEVQDATASLQQVEGSPPPEQ